METAILERIIQLAGAAQVVLALGSLAIPGVLKWADELAKVQPLIKQMVWTHAGYIFVINLCFGMISVCDHQDLTNGSYLSVLVTGFIAVTGFPGF